MRLLPSKSAFGDLLWTSGWWSQGRGREQAAGWVKTYPLPSQTAASASGLWVRRPLVVLKGVRAWLQQGLAVWHAWRMQCVDDAPHEGMWSRLKPNLAWSSFQAGQWLPGLLERRTSS